MKLWRISNHCTLDGLGGERSTGRWHNARKGKPVVYLAEHPALALVETIVNLSGAPSLLPDKYQLLCVEVPTKIEAEKIAPKDLPAGWQQNFSCTQAIGDSWLEGNESALLKVPAAPSPDSWNYLLNPRCPSARDVQIDWCRWITYDRRLFGVREAR